MDAEKLSTDTKVEDKPDESGEVEKLTGLAWWINEAREMVMTILVLLPFWLVFTTLVYELRVIPSESMVPNLLVGDRVAVAKYAYGYNRNSPALGIGRWFTTDDPSDPEQGMFVRSPKRGDVVVFQHPKDNIVLIKRLIGMPGDTIQIVDGRIVLNGEPIKREFVRRVSYRSKSKDRNGRLTNEFINAIEYLETLPDGVSYLTHDVGDNYPTDNTPEFRVPEGHVFMMGDNRDKSADSRAAQGHPELAQASSSAWGKQFDPMAKPTIGYVPIDHLLGRADTVLFTLYNCRETETTSCFKPNLWGDLRE